MILLKEDQAEEIVKCMGTLIRVLECVNGSIQSGQLCAAIASAQHVQGMLTLKLEDTKDEKDL